MKTWIAQQDELARTQFDRAIIERYSDTAQFFEDANEFYRGLTELWNYLDAVKKIDWQKVVSPNAHVLDMGGGNGWLSAYLSRFDAVDRIYNLDSSRYFLESMMPQIVNLMDGKKDKIVPIEGIFAPLLFEDKSLDVVVASSALHHAENLEAVLQEINRVLKVNGQLIILNECPYSYMGHLWLLSKLWVKTVCKLSTKRYTALSPSISASGILYDPYLGDRTYPLWYWKKAITASGLSVHRIVNTGLQTLKNTTNGPELFHMFCLKSPC